MPFVENLCVLFVHSLCLHRSEEGFQHFLYHSLP